MAESLLVVGSVEPVERETDVDFQTAFGQVQLRLVPDVAVPNLYSKVLIEAAQVQSHELALDVGTGSGVVAAGVAAKFRCRMAVSDVQALAVSTARLNVSRVATNAQGCLAFVGDGLHPLRAESVDVIFSQPPQTPAPPHESSATPLITDGGPDGLTFVRELVTEAARVLTPSGRLYVVLASYLPLGRFEAHAARQGFDVRIASRTVCELSPMARARRDYLEREVGWVVPETTDGLPYMELLVYALARSSHVSEPVTMRGAP